MLSLRSGQVSGYIYFTLFVLNSVNKILLLNLNEVFY
jgi:hypothetical protein